jgi:hypothetical protein
VLKHAGEDNYASQSVSAILMMVFQFSSNSGKKIETSTAEEY